MLLLGCPAGLLGQRSVDAAPAALHRSDVALPEAPTPQTDGEQVPDPAQKPQSSSAEANAGAASAPTQATPAQTANPYAVSANGTQQTKRILGVVPNFRSVSADVTLPPQTVKDKFVAAGHDSFDYGSFVLAAVQAGFSMNSDAYPEFHQGVVGYGRYYWHTLVDTADENFMVGGVGPALFHQDSRFYTLGHGGFRRRVVYAATRVLITRGDDGREEPNFSEVIGSGAA